MQITFWGIDSHSIWIESKMTTEIKTMINVQNYMTNYQTFLIIIIHYIKKIKLLKYLQ